MSNTLKGTAYGRKPPIHDPEMTEVGPGKPCGELLRRYWQPVGLTADLGDVPRKIRILGEDLILFRDKSGRPGLLEPRCCHRGTSLYYGRLEERGIRCCYHGWLFDVEGNCLEMPCEPRGQDRTKFVRQPWYPLREYLGLIFAYLGPPDRVPAFPKFDFIEELLQRDDFVIEANEGLGTGGGIVQPCNWLQLYDNVMDPFHVFVLHSSFSTSQFGKLIASRPDVSWAYTESGMKSIQNRTLDDGGIFHRITEVFMPNVRLVAPPTAVPGDPGFGSKGGLLSWIVPFDDVTSTIYGLCPFKLDDKGRPQRFPLETFNGKSWFDLTEEEHQLYPGDQEAIGGQGRITSHAHEHLVTSDTGVMMLRRRLREQIQAVKENRNPLGVVVDSGETLVKTECGNFVINQAAA